MTELQVQVRVADPEAMQTLGLVLGEVLVAGDVVCLTGALGAGKTTFTRGLAVGLGVDDPVSSPTFIIARRSSGHRVDLVHCDVYRLTSPEEFEDLALDPTDAVTVIEWGRALVPLLTDTWVDVEIERTVGAGDEVRTVTLVPGGRGWGTGWDRIARALVAS